MYIVGGIGPSEFLERKQNLNFLSFTLSSSAEFFRNLAGLGIIDGSLSVILQISMGQLNPNFIFNSVDVRMVFFGCFVPAIRSFFFSETNQLSDVIVLLSFCRLSNRGKNV